MLWNARPSASNRPRIPVFRPRQWHYQARWAWSIAYLVRHQTRVLAGRRDRALGPQESAGWIYQELVYELQPDNLNREWRWSGGSTVSLARTLELSGHG